MSAAGRELAAILPDRFRIRHVLGEGTAGVVVAARDTILRRDVAIKLLRTGGAPDAHLLEEARAAAELRHPSIVTIFDVDPKGRYLVMELVDGETLQARLRTGPLEPRAVHGLARALLDALAVAHDHGIIHRDVKPANILFDRDGAIKLNDFGVASRATTPPETIAGTPAYMAPEVWEGAEPDARTDLYGVAVTLWEAAVGKRYRDDESPEDVGAAQVLERTRDPVLAAAIARGLDPVPARRFATAREFAAAIGHRPRRRRRWPAVALAGVIALGVPVLVVTTVAPSAPPVTPARDAGPVVVAVLPFENTADDPQLAAFSEIGLSDVFSRELRHAAGITVIDARQLRERTPEAPAARDVGGWRARASALSAGVVVAGRVSSAGGDVVVEIQVLRTDGSPIDAATARGPPAQVAALLQSPAGRIAAAISGRAQPARLPAPGDLAIERDLAVAIDAVHRMDFADARRRLEEVLARQPDHPEARYWVAIVGYWHFTDPAAIEAAFERALAVDLAPERRGMIEGLRLHVDNEHDRAIEHLAALHARHPTNTELAYGLTEARFHGGRPADAIAGYRALATAAPEFRLGNMHAFDFYVAHGNQEGAEWALLRAQRFRDGYAGTWQARVRALAGDLAGAAELLAGATDGGASFPAGALVLAARRDDVAAVARVARASLDPGIRLAAAVWRGDGEEAARALVQAIDDTRPRGRRGAADLTRIAVVAALADDALVANALAALDDAIGDDERLSVNEQLARAFLHARLGGRAAVAPLASSRVQEVAAVATALVANLDGDPARDAWNTAAELSADGAFVPLGRLRLAEALLAAGEDEAAIATCEHVLSPTVLDHGVVPAMVPCLVVSGAAAARLARKDDAIRAYRRVLAIRTDRDDPLHRAATAALRGLR